MTSALTPAQRVRLGMEVRMVANSRHLVLPTRTLFGWLELAELQLRIPDRCMIGREAHQDDTAIAFQRVRSEVMFARLIMRQGQMDTYVSGQGTVLAKLGVDELVLRCNDSYIGLSARVREAALIADVSTRIYLSCHEGQLRVSCDHPRVYGHLDTPAPVLVHKLVSAILRVDQGANTRSLGLCDFQLRPLRSTLLQVLPAAGWRLPRQDRASCASVEVRREGVELCFEENSQHTTANSSTQAVATLADALQQFRAIDGLLHNGDLEGAMRGYRGELAARGPEQPFLVERILCIASARREYFMDGLELARQVLGRWPDFAPAHAAIASITVAQGDIESAVGRYRELSLASRAVSDDEGTVRAALAGARLVRQFAPDESTRLYEIVLEHRPGHPEAAEALADRYREEERWSDLVRLIRMRLTATRDPQRQALDHARLAEVLATEQNNPDAALAELVAACRLDQTIAPIREQRANVEFLLGLVDDALTSLETANALRRLQGDDHTELRNLIRGGEGALACQRYDTAEAWFRNALSIAHGDSLAMQGAARAAAGQEHHQDAARLWRELLDAGAGTEAMQAHFACELGRSLLAATNYDEARPPLERAVETGELRTRAEALALLAETRLHASDPEAAMDYWQRAITELLSDEAMGPEEQDAPVSRRQQAAAFALQRGEVGIQREQGDEALSDLRKAFDLASPGSTTRKLAARVLLNRTASNEGDLLWVDELLAGNPDRDECAYLAIRRARLLATEGAPDAGLATLALAIEDPEVSDAPKSFALELKAEILQGLGDATARAGVLQERATLSGSSRERAQSAVESAEGWLVAGDLHRCRTALDLALPLLDAPTSFPKLRLRALLCLGDCAWRSRRWQQVQDAYQELYQSDANSAPPQQLLHWGIALEKLGHTTDAIAVLKRVDETHPLGISAAQASRHLADLYERLGELARAASAQEHYAASDTTTLSSAAQADAWYQAGSLHRRQAGSIENAKRCLDTALRIAGNHLPALDALEQIARDEGDDERLAVILGRKIAVMAAHPDRQRGLLIRLAHLQEHALGRVDVARETYRRVLTIAPNYRPALLFAARDAQQSGNSAFASEALELLAGSLEQDSELSLLPEELQRQQDEALFDLASLVEATVGQVASDSITKRLLEEANSRDDMRLWVALAVAYRRHANLVDLANTLEQISRHADDQQALEVDLERIALLANELGDRDAALIALQIAQERTPDSKQLKRWHTILGETARDVSPVGHETNEDTQQSPTVSKYRERAQEALAAGNPSKAVHWLEECARDMANEEIDPDHREALSEVHLHIADLYYGELSSPSKARHHMRSAAAACSSVLWRDATLRQLAAEAASSGHLEEAIDAYEEIGLERLSSHEAFTAAKLYQRVARDHASITLLEATRRAGTLTSEGRSLLFSLQRRRARQQEVAVALELGAIAAPDSIANTRRREALRIYENILDDHESTQRVCQALGTTPTTQGSEIQYAPVLQHVATLDLEAAARHASRNGELAVAASLISHAIQTHCQRLGATSAPVDDTTNRLLASLRGLMSPQDSPSETQVVYSLIQALTEAAIIEHSHPSAAALLQEVAFLRKNELHDRRGATDALAGALALQADNWKLLSDLAKLLEETGDHSQLASAYELHLSVVTEKQRARPLIELGKLYQHTFHEKDKALRCYDEAVLCDEQSSEEVLVLRATLMGDPSAHASEELSTALGRGQAMEVQGRESEAIEDYRVAAEIVIDDTRALNALRRLYAERGEDEALAEVLEQLTHRSESRQERAEFFFERAMLARSNGENDARAYEFLEEAAANAPDNLTYSHTLRTVAEARDEWALAAELLYREIGATDSPEELGALNLELARILDEELQDATAALINYEQALALPNTFAATGPLARLYELASRHENACQMYQEAATSCHDEIDRGRLLRRAAMNAEQAGLAGLAKSLYGSVATEAGENDREAALIAALRISETEAKRAGSNAALSEDERQNESDPKDRARLFYELGLAYQHDLCDANAAMRAYETSLELDRNGADAKAALADLCYQHRDWPRAHRLYQDMDPEHSAFPPAEVARRRAEITEALGHEEEALQAFQWALELSPSDANILTGLCRCASRLGEYEQALVAQRRLVQIIPAEQVDRLRSARVFLADLCLSLGDVSGAIESYESLLVDVPGCRAAKAELPRLYLEAKRPEQAIAAFKALILVTPSYVKRAELLFEIGEALAEHSDDPEQATEAYLRAIDLNPDHVPTLHRLLPHFLDIGDFRTAAEMASDLIRHGALLGAQTSIPVLYRAALAAALSGDPGLARSIGASLGNGAPSEVARAVREIFELANAPTELALTEATHVLCIASNENIASVSMALQHQESARDLVALARQLNEENCS